MFQKMQSAVQICIRTACFRQNVGKILKDGGRTADPLRQCRLFGAGLFSEKGLIEANGLFVIFVPTYKLILCMKKTALFPVASLIMLAACQPFKGNVSSKGIVVDATMNTLTVLSDRGDTLSFSTMDADRTRAHGLLIGDTVEVFYGGEYSKGMSADSVVLYPRQDRADDALGSFLVCTYEGILPAASCPGIRYTLTVRNREHSGDGHFLLRMTYLEAEDGKDAVYNHMGRRYTQRGIPTDPDAVVWQLVTDNGKDAYNFLYDAQKQTLTLLDRQLKPINTGLNYTLKEVDDSDDDMPF